MRKQIATVACVLAIASPCLCAGQADPLVGAWEVVYGQYGLPDAAVELKSPQRPVQLKVFAGGRFAYVRHKEDGSFQAASAGSYLIDGDRYSEKTEWSSVPQAIGTTVTFRWRRVGDSLCVSGPLEVLDSEGKQVGGVKQMKEVMRRAGTTGFGETECQ